MMTDFPNAGYAASIFYLSLFLYLPFLYLFYKNRHIYPISARTPRYILALAFVLYFLALDNWLAGYYGDIYPCPAMSFIGVIPWIDALTLYDYRLLHILFSYRIADKMRQYRGNELQEDWFMKHRWLIRPQFINRFLIVQNAIYIVLWAMLLLDPGNRIPSQCDTDLLSQTLWSTFNYTNQGSAIIICGIIAFHLRRHSGDAFGLKTEISITFYLFVAVFLSWFILQGVGLSLKIASFPVSIAVHTLFLIAIVYPYLLSRKEKLLIANREAAAEARERAVGELGAELASLAAPSSNEMTLLEVITREEGYQLFLNYLETEFSSENLLFWGEVEQLKEIEEGDSSSVDSLRSSLISTFKKFVAEQSSMQVNLPFPIRERLLKALSQPKDFYSSQSFETLSHLFDDAQQNIFDLMNNDSFPRFQNTQEYLKFSRAWKSRVGVGSSVDISMRIDSKTGRLSPRNALTASSSLELMSAVLPSPRSVVIEEEEEERRESESTVALSSPSGLEGGYTYDTGVASSGSSPDPLPLPSPRGRESESETGNLA